MTDLCAIEGCPNPRAQGKGWKRRVCGTHHNRKLRTGSYQADIPLANGMRGCSVPKCTEKHKAAGYCRIHYRRWKKTGNPLGMLGRASTRREFVSYMGAHQRVRAQRGPASDQVCLCGERAAHWAYDHEDLDEQISPEGLAYSLDPNHYSAMCVPCHRAFDNTHRKAG